jgi:hypothetical protein
VLPEVAIIIGGNSSTFHAVLIDEQRTTSVFCQL